MFGFYISQDSHQLKFPLWPSNMIKSKNTGSLSLSVDSAPVDFIICRFWTLRVVFEGDWTFEGEGVLRLCVTACGLCRPQTCVMCKKPLPLVLEGNGKWNFYALIMHFKAQGSCFPPKNQKQQQQQPQRPQALACSFCSLKLASVPNRSTAPAGWEGRVGPNLWVWIHADFGICGGFWEWNPSR